MTQKKRSFKVVAIKAIDITSYEGTNLEGIDELWERAVYFYYFGALIKTYKDPHGKTVYRISNVLDERVKDPDLKCRHQTWDIPVDCVVWMKEMGRIEL